MYMKPSHPVRSYLGLLAALAALSFDACASGEIISTADLNTSRRAAVATVAYDGAAGAARAVYTVPAVDRPRGPPRGESVSEHEVDGWKLLAAVIGLVGIRLWHAGKKILPLIG